MGTFSQLVDEVVSETNRGDLRSSVASYVNQTIRELHSDPIRNSSVLFAANLKEAQLIATLDEGQIWSIPDPTVFQELKAFRFDSIWGTDGTPAYAELRVPGPRLNDAQEAYYRSGDGFALKGYGGVNASISVAWYEFLPRLLYADTATRLASYDFAAGWTYHVSVVGAAAQAAARLSCTNWMIQRWYDTVAEGTRAKVYKRLSDDVRGRTAYSLYQSMRASLVSSEAFESGG